MIERAMFLEPQPKVNVREILGETWFTICLNEQVKNVINEFDHETKEYIQYVYDFNQFSDNSLDVEDVKKNPEKYLHYVPKEKEKVTVQSLEERVNLIASTMDAIVLAMVEGDEITNEA